MCYTSAMLRKLLWCAFVLLASLHAQAVALEQTGFCAAGVSALPQTSPKPTGWAACATPLSAANQTWLIAGNEYVLVNKIVTPVSFAGPATLLKTLTFATLWGYGALGGATTTQSTSLALTGGGFLRGAFTSKSPLSWLLGAVVVKTAAGSQTVLHAGIGAQW